MIYFLKIVLYFLLLYITYKTFQRYSLKNKKVSLVTIILLSLLIGSYSFVCTAHPYVMDKKVYATWFMNDIFQKQVRNESTGLWMIESATHKFTYNADIFFFIVAFLYTFITLIAYRKSKSKPYTLLLLLLSEYPFFGFYQLKQCFAIAFTALGMIEHENHHKIKGYIYILIAIIFHEAALITIPLLIMLRGSKKKIIRIIEYIGFILSVLFFNQITTVIVKIFIKLFPYLGTQLTIYLTDNNSFITDMNYLTIFKGIPFYVIAFYGITRRKQLKNSINNYDKYLIITVFISITIILSMYMYWFFRFGTFYYLFAFMLASEILNKIKEPKEKLLFVLLTAGTFLALAIKLWIQYYFIYGGI